MSQRASQKLNTAC